MMKRAPDNVRYLGQFGEHILTRSFTDRDPEQSSACSDGLAVVRHIRELARPTRSSNELVRFVDFLSAVLRNGAVLVWLARG
jgi:hypothetical protein